MPSGECLRAGAGCLYTVLRGSLLSSYRSDYDLEKDTLLTE